MVRDKDCKKELRNASKNKKSLRKMLLKKIKHARTEISQEPSGECKPKVRKKAIQTQRTTKKGVNTNKKRTQRTGRGSIAHIRLLDPMREYS